MYKKLLNLSICLLGIIFFSTSCLQKPKIVNVDKELKVLAWNIWHKGHTEEYPNKGCEGTIGILKKSEADIILMIETYGAAPMIADSLGFHYELLSSNLCIFSRYPITKTFVFPDQIATFNFGGVEIDMDGTPVRLFDTWLHYLPDTRLVPVSKTEEEILAWENEGSRDEEVRKILTVLQPMLSQSDSIPVIMGGDFNSHSHLDWTDATKDMYNHGGTVVNWTISKEMEAAGFKDSFREMHPDPVKNLGISWIYTGWKIDREDRIDYIYYKGENIRTTESEVYNHRLGEMFTYRGEEFFWASDHGFVLTKFLLTK